MRRQFSRSGCLYRFSRLEGIKRAARKFSKLLLLVLSLEEKSLGWSILDDNKNEKYKAQTAVCRLARLWISAKTNFCSGETRNRENRKEPAEGRREKNCRRKMKEALKKSETRK